MMPTAAGKFTHRVKLMQRTTDQKNELGETIPADVLLNRVWAKVRPLSAKEILANAENTQSVTHEVKLRWSCDLDLTHADWISFKGRTLEIVEIFNIDEENREIAITCNEQQE